MTYRMTKCALFIMALFGDTGPVMAEERKNNVQVSVKLIRQQGEEAVYRYSVANLGRSKIIGLVIADNIALDPNVPLTPRSASDLVRDADITGPSGWFWHRYSKQTSDFLRIEWWGDKNSAIPPGAVWSCFSVHAHRASWRYVEARFVAHFENERILPFVGNLMEEKYNK